MPGAMPRTSSVNVIDVARSLCESIARGEDAEAAGIMDDKVRVWERGVRATFATYLFFQLSSRVWVTRIRRNSCAVRKNRTENNGTLTTDIQTRNVKKDKNILSSHFPMSRRIWLFCPLFAGADAEADLQHASRQGGPGRVRIVSNWGLFGFAHCSGLRVKFELGLAHSLSITFEHTRV